MKIGTYSKPLLAVLALAAFVVRAEAAGGTDRVCAYLETLRRADGAYAFPDQEEAHLTATHAAVATYALLGRDVPKGDLLRTRLPSLDPLGGRGWFDKRTRSYAAKMRAFAWQSVKTDLALGGNGRAWWPTVRDITGVDAYPQAFEKDGNPSMPDVLLVPEIFAILKKPLPEAVRTAFISYLEARRRANGSYNTTPAADGSDGHVVNTACALAARQLLGCAPETGAADWLRACQRPDGGFTWSPNPPLGGVSDLWYAQAAVTALKRLGSAPADPSALRRWLVSLRNGDGGFGDRPGAASDPVATWRAVDVLKAMGWLDVLDLPAPVRAPRGEETYGPELKAWTIQFEAPGSGSVLEAVEVARDEHIHLWGAKNADPKWIELAQKTADRMGVRVKFFRSDESYGRHVGVPGLGAFTHIADPATPPPGAKDRRPFEVWQICDQEALARVLIDGGKYDALAVFHFSTLDNTWLMPWLNRYRHEIPMTALQDSHGETWWWSAPLRALRTVFLAKDPGWDSFREACALKRVTAVREDEHVRGKLTFLGGTRALQAAVLARQAAWRTKDAPPRVSVQLLTPEDTFEVAHPEKGMLIRVRQERRFVEFKGLQKAAYRLEKAVQGGRELAIDRREFRHEKKDYLHGILEEAYDLIPLDPEETAPVVLTFQPTAGSGAKPLVRTVDVTARFRKMDDPLDYRVFVDGREVPTLKAPRPQIRVKPDEAYPYAYAPFVAAGEVTVEVRTENFPLRHAELLPARAGETLEPAGDGAVRFRMRPGTTRVLETVGRHLALVLAANPAERNPPRAGDPNVVCFGPGRHRPGRIALASGQTLYLAPGAVVEGYLDAVGTNMTICGGGVLSGAPYAWRIGPDRFKNVNTVGIMARLVGRDITVRDVTFFSSWAWTLCLERAENALVDNVKVIGGRVINDDGIDVSRSRDVVIRNCFVRCQDDCVAPKWWCENLLVTNCTFWTDIANAVRIGYEADDFPKTGRKFSNLRFTDIDALHLSLEPSKPEDYWCNVALSVQPVNRSRMVNIAFDGWRFHALNPWDVILAVKGFPVTHFYDFPEPGDLDGLLLRNVSGLKGGSETGVYLDMQDPRHRISNVRVENAPGLGRTDRRNARPPTEIGRLLAKVAAGTAPSACGVDGRDFDFPRWTKRLAERQEQIRRSDGAIDLVMVGDSITHFWERNDILGVNGQKQLDRLRETYSVLDLGYSGDLYENVLWRMTNGELDGYEAKLVMLMIGTNNFARQRISPEEGVRRLARILAVIRAKQPKAKVLLLPIFPIGAKPAADGPRAKCNALARRLADGEHILWVDFNAKFLNAKGELPASLFPDRLHPNADGYEIWLAEILPYLERYAARRPPVNPILPVWEHVPDPEPHVFDGRLYIFGSHDAANGWDFCLGDYVGWSAPLDDLGSWRCEGTIFAKSDDPENATGHDALYAPDVAQGPDGRYYLFYQRDNTGEQRDGAAHLGVAVCDRPAGRYRHLGYVRRADGSLYGDRTGDNGFDPSVLVDDDGRIYLYVGVGSTGARAYELKRDMLTIAQEFGQVIPGRGHGAGTSFAGRSFVEASSVRKIDGEYVFVYSCEDQPVLCYATGPTPHGPFTYRGDLNRSSCGNHGGLVRIGGSWYVTRQRNTNGTIFSRQCCAERLERTPDGRFLEAPCTSQGFGGPLPARGYYPAAITFDSEQRVRQIGEGETADVFVAQLKKGTSVGFRYFDCRGVRRMCVETRGWAQGHVEVRLDRPDGPLAGKIATRRSNVWQFFEGDVSIPDGVHALYLVFQCNCLCGYPQIRTFGFP